MLTPYQSYVTKGFGGPPLPTVWHALADNGIHFRRGETTLVAAAPGCGKSAFALTLAVRAKVPTLYLLMDGELHPQRVRIAAMLTGRTLAESEDLLLDDEFAQAVLSQVEHLTFECSGQLEFADVADIIAAYGDAHGDYPHLIVIDNLADVIQDGVDEFAGLRRSASDLVDLALMTKAHMLLLHHVGGDFENDFSTPIPLGGVAGKITKKPTLVLTLTRPMSADRLFVAPVKNRNGRADASGCWRIGLHADLSRMSITDFATV